MWCLGDEIRIKPKNSTNSSANSDANNNRLLYLQICHGVTVLLIQQSSCEKLPSSPDEPAKYTSQRYPTSAIDGITSTMEETIRITRMACIPCLIDTTPKYEAEYDSVCFETVVCIISENKKFRSSTEKYQH